MKNKITIEWLLKAGFTEEILALSGFQHPQEQQWRHKEWPGKFLRYHWDHDLWAIGMDIITEPREKPILPYLLVIDIRTTDELSLALNVLRSHFPDEPDAFAKKIYTWLLGWEQLRDTAIPLRFKEDFINPVPERKEISFEHNMAGLITQIFQHVDEQLSLPVYQQRKNMDQMDKCEDVDSKKYMDLARGKMVRLRDTILKSLDKTGKE